MKTILRVAALAALLVGTTVPANAQLDKFIKKAKEKVEQMTKPEAQKQGDTPAATAPAGVTQTCGGTLANPLASAINIKLVGAYGVKSNEAFGNVYLVLLVEPKVDVNRVQIGGSNGFKEKTFAIDANGNKYETSDYNSYDVMPGTPVKIALNKDAGEMFKSVKTSADKFATVSLVVYVDAGNRGAITLKDVPIQWGVTPE